MRHLFILSFILYSIVFAACSKKTSNNDDIITIDLSKKYEQKEVHLQSVADIEYVALETTDDVLLSGNCRLSYVSDKYIVIYQSSQGDIFIFNRNGKIAFHVNRKGQGGMEYRSISNVIFDEKNEELFVIDSQSLRRILVYTLKGEYKRILKYSEDLLLAAYDFDDETFLVYDETGVNIRDWLEGKYSDTPYLFMSKNDGSMVSKLDFKLPVRYATIMNAGGKTNVLLPPYNRYFYGQDFVIADYSSDTIFKLSKNKELSPLLVRKPSVHSSNPLTFWTNLLTTDMFSILIKVTKDETNFTFPIDTLIHDFRTGETNKVTLINDDLPLEKNFPLGKGNENAFVFIPQKNVSATLMQVITLKNAAEVNQLKGKLEKLVATLKEDDNPVLMIVKFK